ncbi:MAG TPA: SDR family NAD(P)-dependent oxidoreductase [bacterium]|jgi:CDP-paratose 2-epimerase|nr:SDR family NAD(P)-dependent oxidoreductase [bacterium]
MKVLITGGAGFIGCNAASRFLRQGHAVTVYDNLSRPGTAANLKWLKAQGPLKFVKGDVRDAKRVAATVRGVKGLGAVLHYAGQVAVTTSVVDPRNDFEINALGTFNVLEAVRLAQPKGAGPKIALLYSSTNKVYGGMDDIKIVKRDGRYQYKDLPRGIPEDRLLDFHSPYGCSKGAADQYVRDYGRIYGFPTVVFRQSCIYGYRQFGVEDQGWVAWFTIAAELGKPITLYGDGRQVRDVLFIDDLIDAYQAALKNLKRCAGQVYNIGGGPSNQMSLLELLGLLGGLAGKPIRTGFGDWRPGDQPVFVGDIRKAARDFGWKPRIGVREGVTRLHRWVRENRALFTRDRL